MKGKVENVELCEKALRVASTHKCGPRIRTMVQEYRIQCYIIAKQPKYKLSAQDVSEAKSRVEQLEVELKQWLSQTR